MIPSALILNTWSDWNALTHRGLVTPHGVVDQYGPVPFTSNFMMGIFVRRIHRSPITNATPTPTTTAPPPPQPPHPHPWGSSRARNFPPHDAFMCALANTTLCVLYLLSKLRRYILHRSTKVFYNYFPSMQEIIYRRRKYDKGLCHMLTNSVIWHPLMILSFW